VGLSSIEAYDLVADEYDHFYSRPGHLLENAALIEILRGAGLLAVGKHILDLGCGTGSVIVPHADNQHYTGLDGSEGMLVLARRRFAAARFQRWRWGEDFPVSDGCMDVVLSIFGAFNYAADPLRAFEEVRRVLRAGGRFFLMITTAESEVLVANGLKVQRCAYEPLNLLQLIRKVEGLRATIIPFSARHYVLAGRKHD